MISYWQPAKKLGPKFLAWVQQGIERQERRLAFLRGLRLALVIGGALISLCSFIWLIVDLYSAGFFLTLIRPDLYFSLAGLNLMVELVPWENLILLATSLWLVELLVKNQWESNHG